MTKDVYATAEESARAISPDTRTEAHKILWMLQEEQTHGFEMGCEIDNGAIALQLIDQNVELLAMLQKATHALADGLWDYGPGQDEHDLCNEVIAECRAAIAKATAQKQNGGM